MGLLGPTSLSNNVLLVQYRSLRGAELGHLRDGSLKLPKTADCVAEKLRIRTLDIVMSLYDRPLCLNNREGLLRAIICRKCCLMSHRMTARYVAASRVTALGDTGRSFGAALHLVHLVWSNVGAAVMMLCPLPPGGSRHHRNYQMLTLPRKMVTEKTCLSRRYSLRKHVLRVP